MTLRGPTKKQAAEANVILEEEGQPKLVLLQRGRDNGTYSMTFEHLQPKSKSAGKRK